MRFYLMAAVIISGCAPHGVESASMRDELNQAFSICEVVRRPLQFVGKEVVIRAVYLATPHGGQIYGDECQDESIGIRFRQKGNGQADAEKKLQATITRDKASRVSVVLRGIVASRQFIACPQPYCFEYSLSDAQVVELRDSHHKASN